MDLEEQQTRSWVRQQEVACLKLLQGVWVHDLLAQSGLAPWEALQSATCMFEMLLRHDDAAPGQIIQGTSVLHAARAVYTSLSMQNMMTCDVQSVLKYMTGVVWRVTVIIQQS